MTVVEVGEEDSGVVLFGGTGVEGGDVEVRC